MENKYALAHAYEKIVRRGLVKPLACSCGEALTIEPSVDDDNPSFICYSCNSWTTFGINAWGDIRAIVMEHNVDTSEDKK